MLRSQLIDTSTGLLHSRIDVQASSENHESLIRADIAVLLILLGYTSNRDEEQQDPRDANYVC